MTTDPGRMRLFWEAIYPSLLNWQVIGTHSSRRAALRHRRGAAMMRRCVFSEAERGAENATWYVYYFEYDPYGRFKVTAL